jgi:uncharacterized protein (TIGR02453 family)
MINPETLAFLSDLKMNNNKEWFDANRDRYQAVRNGFVDFLEGVIERIGKFDPGISGLDPRKCMFRINRDIRFSKNKAPYKTNFGASITEGGRASVFSGYYIHIEPGSIFAGGGLYHPDSASLAKVRNHIHHEPDGLLSILKGKAFSNIYGGLQGDSLKTAPRDFDKDHPHIDLIRRKDFYVMREYGDAAAIAPDFAEKISGDFQVLYPLVRYFNKGLEG